MGLEAKQFRTKAPLAVRDSEIKHVIVHGTGEVALAKCLSLYVHSKTQPHYMIDLAGELYQFCEEHEIAGHAGMPAAERLMYRAGYQHWSCFEWDAENRIAVPGGQELPRYRHWRDYWRVGRNMESPLDIIGPSPNHVSIGIELLSPVRRGPNIYTDAQYGRLAALLIEISARYTLRLERGTVLGHSDVSPMRRYYDPGDKFNWNKLWDLIGKR